MKAERTSTTRLKQKVKRQMEKKNVKIVQMDGKKDRFVVVEIETNKVVLDGNQCGYKSRVNAQRAIPKNLYKLVYDEETKEECAEYYSNRNRMRSFMSSKGWWND